MVFVKDYYKVLATKNRRQVDKEVIGLSSPTIFHPCVTSEIFVNCLTYSRC